MVLLAAVAIVCALTISSPRLDPGLRRLLIFIVSVAALTAIAAWFFFLAGLSLRVRTVGALVLVGLAMFLALSVRRVEFSGDMEPTFDFRWQPERMAVLEEHRTRQLDDGGQRAPVDLSGVQPGADDVLEYRGPRRDGEMPGPALARDWSQEPPKQLWRQPVGGGYASFLVIGPALVTIEQRRDKEAIVAYEAASGREIWVHDYPALFSETLGGDGPRATPTYHDGKIYSLGATGVLACLDFATGKKIWSFNILAENGCGNLDWGMSGSPLVHDGAVLVNPGAQKGTADSRSLVAYGIDDGTRHFGGGHSKAGYSSPMLATLGGVEQVLLFDGGGLAGFDPHDGRELWRVAWPSDFDINAAQPVVVDDHRVAITSASGTALVKVTLAEDRWTAETLWSSRRMKGGYTNPIARDGYLYGIDGSLLACIDLADGKLKWKARGGQVGHGQLLLRDDLLVVLGEAGQLLLVEATPEGFHELGQIQAIEGKTWNVPALVGNRVYVRNHLEMAAYELPLAGEGAGSDSEP